MAIGNHELYDNQGNYLASLEGEYQYFFSEMPGNGPAAYNKLAYSVEFGNSLFIVLDTFGFMDGNQIGTMASMSCSIGGFMPRLSNPRPNINLS